MRFKHFKFGPFPHELVNRTLGTELEPGNVFCSVPAQKHMFDKHPADFSMVTANLPAIIQEPTYIGQAPHQARNLEFIKRIAVQEQDADEQVLRRYVALAAVGLAPDEQGDYRIRSGYLIDEEDVTLWRAKGNLLVPKK